MIKQPKFKHKNLGLLEENVVISVGDLRLVLVTNDVLDMTGKAQATKGKSRQIRPDIENILF